MFDRLSALRPSALSAVLAAALLAACGGRSAKTNSAGGGAGQEVTVTVTPTSATVPPGGQQPFNASVTGSASTAVTWAVQEGASGGAVTAAGLFTAASTPGTYHVVATSAADPSKTGVATITIQAPPPPVVVTVTPGSGTVDECQPLAFTATVTGSTNTSVTWSLQEGAAAGAISAAGIYTAGSAGSYHVVATSAVDPTRTAVVPVTVTQHVLSVAVTPSTIVVPANGTAQFSASVTTTCGTTTALRVVDATGRISAAN